MSPEGPIGDKKTPEIKSTDSILVITLKKIINDKGFTVDQAASDFLSHVTLGMGDEEEYRKGINAAVEIIKKELGEKA